MPKFLVKSFWNCPKGHSLELRAGLPPLILPSPAGGGGLWVTPEKGIDDLRGALHDLHGEG